MNKVAISIGHSTKDTGAIAVHDGVKYIEYELNKALFKEVTDLKLKNGEWWQSDHNVDDLPYPQHLVKTTQNINASDAVCCIELHHNSVTNRKVNGGMAIYWDSSVKGKLLADYISMYMTWWPYFDFEGFKIYWCKTQYKKYKGCDKVATQAHIHRRLAFLRPPTKEKCGTRIPACIVEPGFMSNWDDLQFCIKNVKRIAMAIRDGVDLWLAKEHGQ